jgi:hypothetical protein
MNAILKIAHPHNDSISIIDELKALRYAPQQS